MKYIEIRENYSPEQDAQTAIELSDTRKHRLTLAHLSKLRKIREYRKYEDGVKSVQIKQMYGGPAEGSDAGGELEM